MINQPSKNDFFPATDEHLAELSISYQDTEEDLRHQEYLRELEAKINENSDATLEDDLGELPFDEEADRKRWENLEKEFDLVFDHLKKC